MYVLDPSNQLLGSNALGTADFCLFMDKCFDSVNGSTLKSTNGKILRSAVKPNSEHLKFWNEAITVFESMYFIRSDGKKSVPPSVIHWIETLKSFKHLWLNLKSCNLKFLLPRHINQDPLECLFGCFRQHAGRNINPDCYHFMTSFKTLLLNNFSSIKSINANCKADNLKPLSNLKQFLQCTQINYNDDIQITPNFTEISSLNNEQNKLILGDMTITYVIGYMAKQILKIVNECQTCELDLIDKTAQNKLINVRNFTSKKSLSHPSSKLFNIVKNILCHFSCIISNIFSSLFISKQLALSADLNVDFPTFSCKNHNLKDIIISNTINFYLFTCTKNLNRILYGVDTQSSNNKLKQITIQYYKKHSKRYISKSTKPSN